MDSRPWTPLLEGDLRAQTEASLLEIAEAVATHPFVRQEGGRPSHPNLPSGFAGIGVFYAYLHAYTGDPAHRELAGSLLENCIDMVGSADMRPALHGGFVGVAWALHHVTEMWGEEDLVAEIDEAMVEILEAGPWQYDYDLIEGLVGFGLYALDRLPRPHARRMLELVLEQLDRTAESTDAGTTWFTPPAWLPSHQREVYPNGYHNLGLAHGVPGVVGLLGQAIRAGVGGNRVRDLFEGSVRWLLAQENTTGESCFGHMAEGEPHSRVAWCYGDLGLARALWIGSDAAGRPDWCAEAMRILHKVAPRFSDPAVLDASLCHGMAGNALIFQRIADDSGEAVFAETARRWIERSLASRRPEGVAGYAAHMPMEQVDDLIWRPEPGLLTGASGVGLAYLAALSGVEPRWDRCLLVSASR